MWNILLDALAEGDAHERLLQLHPTVLGGYRLLTNPPPTPDGTDLRHHRTQARITLTQAAHRLDTQPTLLSRLEGGLYHNHQLATRYQQWINTRQPICTK